MTKSDMKQNALIPVAILLLANSGDFTTSFTFQNNPSRPSSLRYDHHKIGIQQKVTSSISQKPRKINNKESLLFSTPNPNDSETQKRIIAPPILRRDTIIEQDLIEIPEEEEEEEDVQGKAATNTVNERLLAEVQQQVRVTKGGSSNGMSPFGRPSKTEAEREASIAEARDLNGVNPVVAISASLFSFGFAAGLWWLTGFAGDYFSAHPVETDVYFIQRITSVFRNLIMGLFSLCSGFCGVTGLGLFLLGFRVADGVRKGELDPTPIKKKGEEVVVPNVWDLMMGKKPGRRS